MPNEQANGVAIVSSKHPDNGFVIAKTQSESKKTWGTYDLSISGVVNAGNISQAELDYSGYSNTNEIISQDIGNPQAANYCRSYIFPNGKIGYLPGFGEMKIAYDNKNDIDKCMSKIGGSIISNNYYYWSSTPENSIYVWILNFSNYTYSSMPKLDTNYVLAFSTLK